MRDIHATKLLIVDDESALRVMLEKLLRQEGYRDIRLAATAAEALAYVRESEPDALLLDVMLPDDDGFSLFQKLRRFTNAPVLFLSARDEDEAKLRGLGLGADDYITKPFLPKELTLRLAAVLRRTYGAAEDAEGARRLHLGGVTVDFESGTVSGNGEDKALTAKEYALMKKLAENTGRIVTLDTLCLAAWDDGNPGYENTLMVHMRRLREKVEPDPSHPQYILTVRGLGYKLVGEARK